MRPTRLRLRGITRYVDEVDLDLASLPPGLIAIVGGNGQGKTTLLGCMGPGPLYLELPSYPGKIRDSVRDSTPDAFIELDIEYAASSWRSLVQMDTMKGKTEPVLYRNGVPLNENLRQGDYKEVVAKHFPTPEFLYAAAFSVQTGDGSFFDMKATDRRALFGQLLGLGELDGLALRCRELQKSAMSARKLANDSLYEARRPLEGSAQRRTRHDQLTAEIAAATPALQSLTESLESSREAFAAAREESARISAERERRDAVEADLRSQEQRRDDLDEQLAALPDLDALRAELAEVIDLEQQRNDATTALASAREAVSKAQAATARWNQAHAEAVGVANRARGDISRYERAAALLAEVPCEARSDLYYFESPHAQTPQGSVDCSTCDLLKDARAARDALEPRRRDLEKADATLQQVKDEEPPPAPVEDVSAAQAKSALLDGRIAGRSSKKLREALEAAGPDPAVLKAQRGEVVRRIADLATQVETWDELPIPPDLVTLKQQGTTLASQTETATQHLARLREELAGIEAAMSAAAGAAERIKELEAKVDRIGRDIASLKLLGRALGREGIQALEIDAAGPEISELLNQLLESIFGARFTATLRTVAPKADGGQKEVFDLVIHDGQRDGEPRPASRYSVGERTIISEALKLALAIFRSRRARDPILTLWRDECDGDLEIELARAYPSMLRAAMELGGYRNVYLISHNPEVWSQADAWIHVHDGKAQISDVARPSR